MVRPSPYVFSLTAYCLRVDFGYFGYIAMELKEPCAMYAQPLYDGTSRLLLGSGADGGVRVGNPIAPAVGFTMRMLGTRTILLNY
ncbi:hypothetical protein Back11_46030 [Paenibacillus baekrokdamisoli]|uniref:Uncharacterized protein n=1 Tax=Paenibacillus baekrokdamisoli TaxID=1712516 RepID=A0A3G9JGS5_9BACL|nr:hypothetical protein [Paenibacillus baekrokdamisoli]BBH23258.1 hypothetical protein Back11_46030 [Paenibacillus baekrokdamisoli]